MISIVVPTLGRSETITRALKSASLVRKDLVKEILILDNSQLECFSNELGEIVEDLNDSRVKIVKYSSRKTMADSWNGGLYNAIHNWVLYLHDDDELIAENLNKISSLKLSKPFYSFDYILNINGKSQKIIRGINKSHTYMVSIINNCPKFASTIINKNSLLDIGGWNDKYGYFLDLVGFVEMAALGKPEFDTNIIGIYYKHKDNLSSVDKRAENYGNFIPAVTEKLFSILEEADYRREIIHLYNRFVYPTHESNIMRVASKLEALHRKLFSIFNH